MVKRLNPLVAPLVVAAVATVVAVILQSVTLASLAEQAGDVRHVRSQLDEQRLYDAMSNAFRVKSAGDRASSLRLGDLTIDVHPKAATVPGQVFDFAFKPYVFEDEVDGSARQHLEFNLIISSTHDFFTVLQDECQVFITYELSYDKRPNVQSFVTECVEVMDDAGVAQNVEGRFSFRHLRSSLVRIVTRVGSGLEKLSKTAIDGAMGGIRTAAVSVIAEVEGAVVGPLLALFDCEVRRTGLPSRPPARRALTPPRPTRRRPLGRRRRIPSARRGA